MISKQLAAIAVSAALLLTSCGSDRTQVIFDTDIGNDVDDVEALAMLYHYADAGNADILGICLNKTGDITVRFVDMMARWYGYPDVPLGMVHTDGPTGWAPEECYTGKVLKDFPSFDVETRDSLPEAYLLYRRLLSGADDHSVTVLSVGFLTNLVSLLDSPADDISPMTGRELIEAKVKRLVIMAGRFDECEPEFNVVMDIPASVKVFSTWPGQIDVLPWELGMSVRYPHSSIENDYGWTDFHPFKEAYLRYCKMPFDNPMFDPSAAVFAAGDTSLFTPGPFGKVTVDSLGVTRFSEGGGLTRVITLSDGQVEELVRYFTEWLPRVPASRAE